MAERADSNLRRWIVNGAEAESIRGSRLKLELLQRQAYGFRNFENYRLRVTVLLA
jgi:transposase